MAVIFKTEFIDNTIPNDPRLEELKYWCREFQKRNLTPLYKERSLGNLSFRIKDKHESFIITAAALALKDDLTDDSFVIIRSYDPERGIVFASGTKEPSSESVLHFSIYSKRKDVNAVFHGHSGRIIYSSDDLELASTKQFEQYGSIELVKSVLDVLGDELFLVMKKHGFLALGKNMEEAGTCAMKVYEQAQALKIQKIQSKHQEDRTSR
ncbi:MAG: class II aldolase/adducin family protein [Deltaproteobacteria bacterium]|nr:class II aldolase/adducin family protein [Deltaproteobacteria bacterium]